MEYRDAFRQGIYARLPRVAAVAIAIQPPLALLTHRRSSGPGSGCRFRKSQPEPARAASPREPFLAIGFLPAIDSEAPASPIRASNPGPGSRMAGRLAPHVFPVFSRRPGDAGHATTGRHQRETETPGPACEGVGARTRRGGGPGRGDCRPHGQQAARANRRDERSARWDEKTAGGKKAGAKKAAGGAKSGGRKAAPSRRRKAATKKR